MTFVQQGVLPILPHELRVFKHNQENAQRAAANLASSTCWVFGLALSQKDDGVFAVATQDEIYFIDAKDAPPSKLDTLFYKLLASEGKSLAGFGMVKLALRLHEHFHHRIRGVDLSTMFLNASEGAVPPSKVIQKSGLCRLTNTFRVDRLWHQNNKQEGFEHLCLRAWISAKVANCASSVPVIRSAQKVDTNLVEDEILACLSTLVEQNDMLARALPLVSNNEFESFELDKQGKMKVVNSRYKTRVRHNSSNQSYIEVKDQNGSKHKGSTTGAKGKTTGLKFQKSIPKTGPIESVSVVGLEDLTPAEKAQDALLLRILQGKVSILDAPFVRYLWFVQTKEDEECLRASTEVFDETEYTSHLNQSQIQVVGAMTATTGSPVVVVHGPPGTGKTSTIVAAAETWSKKLLEPVWIIGNSNVTVKNIAEKLLQRNVDFKLIVSVEFYVEWHEHIYKRIQGKLIRTDQLPKDRFALSQEIGSSTVILSTLALLANPNLERKGVFDIVPVQNLVVDEASQINHVFYELRKTLKRVCFSGDPKQLPPYGKEQCKSLKSVFELAHLDNCFLNTQCESFCLSSSFQLTLVY
ncbi:hypothetical protein GYMLUDRAFT_77826 [Collybiopsis luxurians FD-317 M1]|uniref:DNA2/NAM7 helicase helicase domain-containing protein n=1 Tax=Collybiopsis luxurians FD-317 M1 TaxID=944289 RepID=A0A0D0BS16_9AGAR|nr:hypothetical protein GYMLUDRAFT_77826 [Collybiopsis luxurians FD-317 M1]